MNVPITVGDGLGTTTNNPANVTVTVDGTEVDVDSLDGATGQIILHEAPQVCKPVLVTYWYKISPEIFKGRAWVSGDSGTILMTSDIGATWTQQTSNTSYDLNGVSFFDQNKGWVAGDFSVMRHTEDGGTTWTEQISDTVSRRVQKVFYEGNTAATDTFLDDEMIHPDTNIETTKRIQIQYKIRVIENVDPASYPDAGLGSDAIVALGPNDTGTFAYQNMGSSTGDYGLWQARCTNTVDGLAWAIPMFFVSRRNSTAYSAASNANGSNVKGDTIRPDLLTGTDIVDQDILDVRRQIITPSVTELLNKNFDALMNNELKTRFFRQTTGGDSYAVEPLQLDYINSGSGTEINASLSDAVSGEVSSDTTISSYSGSVPATTVVPSAYILKISDISSSIRGLFHPNPTYYAVQYRSPGSVYDGKPVPGRLTGIGTDEITFTFSSKTNTTNDDINLTDYDITAHYVEFSSKSLNRVPSVPQLVENTSGSTTDPSFFYRGVFTSETSGREIEEWDSGITGYPSYTLAYPAIDAGGSAQEARASSIEVHKYIRLTSTEIQTANQIKISTKVYPDTGDSSYYTINCISKINNITSGFSFKLEDIVVVPDEITITSVSGFPFIEDTIIEVVGMALASTGDTHVRNGASVNFTRGEKKISPFCYSSRLKLTYSVLVSRTSASFSSTNVDTGQISTSGGIFLGISTTETIDSLTEHFAWIDDVLTPVTVTGFGTTSLDITFPSATPSSIKIQAFIKQAGLLYSGSSAGLQIAYNFVPNQNPNNLPTSLVTEMVTNPTNINISNLGTGGSRVTREPYDFPLESIAVNNISIINDNEFYNLDLLRFVNFSIDSGFVQMPVYIPGSFGEEMTFSGLTIDNLFRTYYSTCDKEFTFRTEDIRIGVPRKIYIAMIGRVKENSTQLLRGEYVLVVISRDSLLETENYVGCETGATNAISVYRLPNKPLIRK